jgi:hypothetical protein
LFAVSCTIVLGFVVRGYVAMWYEQRYGEAIALTVVSIVAVSTGLFLYRQRRRDRRRGQNR